VVDAASKKSFVNSVLPRTRKKELGILAMKTLADGRFFAKKEVNGQTSWETADPVVPGRISLEDALDFAWSLPVSVLITGAENAGLIKEKIERARAFIARALEERTALMQRVADLAAAGQVEYYKEI
jgi:hypothetical protein